MESAQSRLPYAIEAAVVEVAGKAFWYKRPLETALERAGVPAPLIRKYAGEAKYVIAREVWGELLDRGPAGLKVQHQIVRDLASLKSFGDEVDARAALAAVKALREAAEEADIVSPQVAVVDREVIKREKKQKTDAYDRRLRSKKLSQNP